MKRKFFLPCILSWILLPSIGIAASQVDCADETSRARDQCAKGQSSNWRECIQGKLSTSCREQVKIAPEPAWAPPRLCQEEVLKASSACETGTFVSQCLNSAVSASCLSQVRRGSQVDAACKAEVSQASRQCASKAMEVGRLCVRGRLSSACQQSVADSESKLEQGVAACKAATEKASKACGSFATNQKCFEQYKATIADACQ
jgi:hypothetical protein